MDAVSIAAGAALSPFVTIAANVTIGKCFHANLYSYVEHDCVIGDYVTFAPRVSCNGNIHIHDDAYIGTGTVIKQGTPDKPLVIGEGAIVGMGAVVTKDVPAGATVIGNPASDNTRGQSRSVAYGISYIACKNRNHKLETENTNIQYTVPTASFGNL